MYTHVCYAYDTSTARYEYISELTNTVFVHNLASKHVRILCKPYFRCS